MELWILLGVAFMIRALQMAFFGPTPLAIAKKTAPEFEPISVPERFGAALLMACTLVIGLQPSLLLDLIVPALNQPLFAPLLKNIPP